MCWLLHYCWEWVGCCPSVWNVLAAAHLLGMCWLLPFCWECVGCCTPVGNVLAAAHLLGMWWVLHASREYVLCFHGCCPRAGIEFSVRELCSSRQLYDLQLDKVHNGPQFSGGVGLVARELFTLGERRRYKPSSIAALLHATIWTLWTELGSQRVYHALQFTAQVQNSRAVTLIHWNESRF